MKSNRFIHLLLVLSALVSGCSDLSKNQEACAVKKDSLDTQKKVTLTDEQIRTSGIVTGNFESKKIRAHIKSSGFLKVPPQNKADVSTFMGGVVKSIVVVEGSYVRKGQVLATLEHPEFTKLQEEYLKAKNNLNFLEKEYLRQRELHQENVNSGKVFEQAETNYYMEKNRLASLKDQLQKLSISIEKLNEGQIASYVPVKSPIDGYLSKVNINTGAFAQPSQQLFEVVNTDHIHIDLLVYEEHWFKVKEGNKVYVTLPNRSDEKIEGVVFAVGKSFDMESKTLPVHAEIVNNQKLKLVPGIYVNGEIEVEEVKATAIPDEAILNKQGKKLIFYRSAGDTGNTFLMKEIKTGMSDGGFTEVLLSDDIRGKVLVIKGAYYLLAEMEKDAGAE